MSERKKDMLTGLEDNILSSEWVLVIATDCYFQKKNMLKLFFSLYCLALVLSFVMATKR